MATQVLTRKQRGERIAPEDVEQINPSSFFVRSQSGRSGYSVTRVGQSWECDCPDNRYRGVKCKHIYAVESYLPEQTADAHFALNLWEATA
jgi:hypothetical protein